MTTVMKNNYWIELIGFDKDDKQSSVLDFIKKQNGRIDSVYLLLYAIDFVMQYNGMDNEYVLDRSECSYGGHQYSDEREIQPWTNYDLKELIDIFHKENIRVYLSHFSASKRINFSWQKGEVKTSYAHMYPEIFEFSAKMYTITNGACMIKRYADGSFFEDDYVKKLKKVLSDYNFDGIHIADGVSSPRLRIVQGDFSDDLVEQFVSRTGIKLPNEYPIKCEHNKALLQKRFRYIIDNLRYEWTIFISERYAEFIKKVVQSMHSIGKLVTLNNAWTCGPFESLYRYGIDYRLLADSGLDTIMFEDSSAQSISGWAELTMHVSEQTRWNTPFAFMEKQRSLKLSCPEVPMINMTCIHDTYEQWDIIRNAPNEFKTAIARRSISYVLNDGELTPTCEGSVFCLSDCVDKQNWDYIHKTIDEFDFENKNTEGIGFVTLYDSDYKSEFKEFIKSRRLYSAYVNDKFTHYGLCAVALADYKEIMNCSNPILGCSDSIREHDFKDYLENNKDRLIVLAGLKKLDRKADATFKCGKFEINVYNAKNKARKVYSGYKEVSLYYDDPHMSQRMEPPRHTKINEKIFADAVDFINKEGKVPYLLRPHELINSKGKPDFPANFEKGNVMLFMYRVEKNRYRLYALNKDNYFNHPFVKLPFKVKDAYMVGRPLWTKPNLDFGGEVLSFQIYNRATVVIDLFV